MGKFRKTIHFIIFIKLFFINYPYLGSKEGKDCCKSLCPCFYQSEESKSNINDINNEEENNKNNLIESKKTILRGLNNIGATCYMNATLQCLSNTKKLTEYFLNNYEKGQNKIMANEYYEVIKNLWNKDDNEKAYSPNSFKDVLSKENPLFAGIAANDSKDLINFLIERLHLELNFINQNKNNNNDCIDQLDQTNELSMLKIFIEEFNQKFNSPVSNLFYGILETKSRCQGCNIIKFNFQHPAKLLQDLHYVL